MKKINELADENENLLKKVIQDIEERTSSRSRSNIYALLGGSGTGKSKILNELYSRNQSNDSRNPLMIFPILACLNIPNEMAPSSALLLHMSTQFKDKIWKNSTDDKIRKRKEELDKLISSFAKTSLAHQQLGLELSTSLDEYGHYLVRGMKERFSTSKDLEAWLEDQAESLKINQFVVLIDDLDFSSDEKIFQWLSSALNELNQKRLTLVIAIDEQRLQQLDWENVAGFRAGTSRKFLTKILPPQNRFKVNTYDVKANINYPKELPNNSRLEFVMHLLPSQPRGLSNFLETFKSWNSNTSDISLLSLLADCRNEPALMKALPSVDKPGWLRSLNLTNEKMTYEDWEDLVEDACQRFKDPQKITPFSELGREEIWQPLGGVSGKDRALWMELLINRKVAEDQPRNRVRFLQLWTPLKTRLEETSIKIEFSRQSIRDFFMGGDWLPSREGLSWMDIDLKNQPTVYLGWHTLLEDLRGERMPLLARVTTDLYLNTNMFEDQNPRQKIKPGSQKALGLIPTEIWAILLLTDGLDRCCWKAFGSNLGWNLSTYMVLAAALVRSAYAYALYQGKILALTDFSIHQRDFIRILENRDPQILLGLQQEDIVEKLFKLFGGSFQTKLRNKGAHDALSKATMAFLESPAYTTVHQLINDIADDVLE